MTEISDAPAAGGLRCKIINRTAKVGVIGLGYVGLPTMVAAVKAGYIATGIELNPWRTEEVNAGRSYVEDVPDEALAPLVEQKKISATTSYDVISELDVIIICVPTPVDTHKEPDLAPLQDAVEQLAKHMAGEQLLVLQSTTFPGTTEEVALPRLQKTGKEVGRDFYLAFSPERIDPGNKVHSLVNIPKVVGGVTPACSEVASAFFETFVDTVIPVSSPKVAEMTKLLENVFRSVNIALVTELSQLGHRMGIDIREVIEAAATKPFGYMPFYPGVGVGGHCIPVDPFYLSWKAKEYDFYVNFVDLAARTNDDRPYYVVSRIGEILGERGKTIKGARLLLLGVSFKKDIRDVRNSPALQIASMLAQRDADLSYSDIHVPEVPIGDGSIKSIELNEKALLQHDAAIVLVDHSYYNWPKIIDHSKLVIDAQGALRSLGSKKNVVAI